MKNDTHHGKGKVWFLEEWEGAYKNISIMSFNMHCQKSIYIGDFDLNEIQGRGAYFREDKRKYYEGQVKNNKFHGKGTFYFLEEGTRSKYVGEFIEGAFGGHGERFWENGRYGKGTFVDGKMSGPDCLMKEADGRFYQGSFKADKMDGDGKMQMPGEWEYEGNFTQDEM